MTNNY